MLLDPNGMGQLVLSMSSIGQFASGNPPGRPIAMPHPALNRKVHQYTVVQNINRRTRNRNRVSNAWEGSTLQNPHDGTRGSASHATFRALVGALIPSTPELAARFGSEQAYGAKELGVADYVIWILNHLIALPPGPLQSNVCLSEATAQVLDVAASELVEHASKNTPAGRAGQTAENRLERNGLFASLSRRNRLLAMTLLEKKAVNLAALPAPYTNNPGFLVYMTQMLKMWALFGYYSEWSGYGSTRTLTPALRKLEFFPPSWRQVQYPGTALGYRDYKQALFEMSSVRGGSQHE